MNFFDAFKKKGDKGPKKKKKLFGKRDKKNLATIVDMDPPAKMFPEEGEEDITI